jgi:hypothetical protein
MAKSDNTAKKSTVARKPINPNIKVYVIYPKNAFPSTEAFEAFKNAVSYTRSAEEALDKIEGDGNLGYFAMQIARTSGTRRSSKDAASEEVQS